MTSKTVEKSLVLLEALADSEGPRGVGELGRALAMPKSNVFRLLETLVRHGYVRRRADDSRYELTLKLWELGSRVVGRTRLTDVASPCLAELARATGESAHLAVYDDGESVYIDKKDGPRPIAGVTKIGGRAPAHCTATGKVELAHQPEQELRRVARRRLSRFTEATITSRAALEVELAGVRARGYAVNHGEWFEDVWGVAAPIRDARGVVRASVGVWGPRQRLYRATGRVAGHVVAAADEISRGMGFSAPGRAANDRRAST